MRKFLFFGLAILLSIFVWLVGQPLALAEGEQQASQGELVAGREVVQTFRASQNDLQRLTVEFETPAKAVNCSVRLRLVDTSASRTVLEQIIPCQDLQKSPTLSLPFEPNANSKGQTYQLILSSPDGQSGSAITPVIHPQADLDGKLSIDGKPVTGGLALIFGYRYQGYVDKYWQTIFTALILAVLLGLGLMAGWIVWYWKTSAPLSFRRYLLPLRSELVVLGLVFVLYMLAVPYTQFADEYDNILGGRYIDQGSLPYSGFFSHHMPLSYYLAAPITFFTQSDVWAFRAIFLFLLYLWALGIYALFRHYGSRVAGQFFLVFVGVSMLVYYGHMLLAETLVAYASVTLILLFTLKFRRNYAITRGDIVLVSLLTATIALNSLGYIFLAVYFYLYFGYLFLRQQLSKSPVSEDLRPRYLKNFLAFARYNTANLLQFLLIVVAPYLLLLLVLVLSNGFERFVFENYDFNAYYYSQFNNDIKGSLFDSLFWIVSRFANGVEVATTNFLNTSNYQAFFSLLAIVSLVGFWLFRRYYARVALLVPVVILASPRGGPGQNWQVNFHATPFIVISILAACLALVEIYTYLKDNNVWLLRGLYYLLAIYTFFVVAGAASSSATIYYNYFNQESVNLITASPNDAAVTINDLASPDEKVWIAPFDYDTLLSVNAKPAVSYPFVLPWVAVCDRCEKDILQTLATNPPKLVYWLPNIHMKDWNNISVDDYAYDVLQYLKQNYFQVKNSKDGKLNNFYFPKSQQTAIMSELKAKGYIE